MNRAKYHCNQLAGSNIDDRDAARAVPLLPPAKRQRTAAGDEQAPSSTTYKLPEGESEESLNEKEIELQDMSKLAETEYDHDKISHYMELLHNKIYSIVRLSQITIDDLFLKYPFLIKLVWCRQYVLLSEKTDVEQRFKTFVDTRLDAAIRFLTRKSSSVDICVRIEEEMIKLQKTTTSRVPRIVGGLLMIASHLEKSKYKGIFKIMDASSPNDVINIEKDLPLITPKLVALGTHPMVAEEFCLVANGRVVDRTQSIIHAFSSYFSAFYAMHVQYPSELATFLEFVQRYIMDIADEGNVKLTSRGKTMKPGWKQAFTQTAVKLHQKIEEFARE